MVHEICIGGRMGGEQAWLPGVYDFSLLALGGCDGYLGVVSCT